MSRRKRALVIYNLGLPFLSRRFLTYSFAPAVFQPFISLSFTTYRVTNDKWNTRLFSKAKKKRKEAVRSYMSIFRSKTWNAHTRTTYRFIFTWRQSFRDMNRKNIDSFVFFTDVLHWFYPDSLFLVAFQPWRSALIFFFNCNQRSCHSNFCSKFQI